MAPLELLTLRSLLHHGLQPGLWSVPKASWSQPLGLGRKKSYRSPVTSTPYNKCWHGMPLGGFGTGCIGRSCRGDITLWHLDSKRNQYGSIPDCQFALYEKQGGSTRAYVLAASPNLDNSRKGSNNSLLAWQWYPASTTSHSTGICAVRYPLSWTQYDKVFRSSVICEAFSPIFPGDYRRTSYPVAVFCWHLRNPGYQFLELSLLLSWRNTIGWLFNTLPSAHLDFCNDGSRQYNQELAATNSEGQFNHWIDQPGLTGVLLEGARSEPIAEGEGQWCLALPDNLGDAEIMRCSRWDLDSSGAELWQMFASEGRIPVSNNDRQSRTGEQASAAVAVKLNLAPGELREIPFVISWDLPVIVFANGIRDRRRYTDFFGAGGNSAATIAAEALKSWRSWRSEINAWQAPVLARTELPEDMRMALFNELCRLASSHSFWTAAQPDEPLGRFGMLEDFNYDQYEGPSLHLYNSSFALLQLWPELDKAILCGFAHAILSGDDKTLLPAGKYLSQGQKLADALHKLQKATCRELETSGEEFVKANSYHNYQRQNLWEYLVSNFVLQVWLIFKLAPTGEDLNFLAKCWPASVQVLGILKSLSNNFDTLIKDGETLSQTSANWSPKELSAYYGKLPLQIGAVEAALAMSQRLQLKLGLETSNEQHELGAWLEQLRKRFDCLPWKDEYCRNNFGSGESALIADWICSDFYARLLSLPAVMSDVDVYNLLKAIKRAKALDSGQIGALSRLQGADIRPGSRSTLVLDAWISLAAYCRLIGDSQTAGTICKIVIQQLYDEDCLQFSTPEAVTVASLSRYPQGTAIWATWAVHTDWQTIPGANQVVR
ncbi:bile acid beta-glucosidase [cyanobiont of Ornithocercus magnificus]|nr:bile acid beta-glucosidase [cyanobiont of Ornithocercus magnificus]